MKQFLKIGSVLIAFLFLVTIVYAATASTRLTTARTTVRKGATTDIYVRIDASNRIRGGQFNVNLNNNNFEIVRVKGSNTFSVSKSGDFYLIYKVESGFSVASGSAIAVIRVKPKSSAVVGSKTTLTVSNVAVTLEGSYDTISAGSKAISLTVGEAIVETTLSDNNYLKSLSSEVVEIPFDKNLLDYSVIVPNSATSLDLKAEVEDEKATYLINGDKDFKVGTNLIEVVVTAENGATKTYTITVERDRSDNNKLKSLEIKDFEIDFKNDLYQYQINTDDKDLTKLEISFETEDENAKTEIIGNENFTIGKNQVIIIVTAENGDTQTYAITVNITDGSIIKEASNVNLFVVILAIILSMIVIGQLYFIYTWKRNHQ